MLRVELLPAIPFLFLFFVQGALATTRNCSTEVLPRVPTFRLWRAQGRELSNPLQPTRLDLPVLVIGGGPGGLTAVKTLKDRGIAVRGVEQFSDIGGLWNANNPHSVAYDSLKMDTSWFTSHFGEPGDRKEKPWPKYFTREVAFDFLQDYAQKHHLRSAYRFNTSINWMEKDDSGAWHVGYSDGTTHQYRAVVIATGKYNPQTAVVPEDLRAQAEISGLRWLHSSSYRNPVQSNLVGERVLIVGSSNTAVDLATELSRHAEEVWLSVRTTRWPIPEFVAGIPADEFAANGPKLPHWLEAPLFRLLQWLLVGPPRRWGFADPDHQLLDKLPIPDRGILAAIQSGRVQLRSAIEKIDPYGQVHFHPSRRPSDRTVAPTVVLFATGYEQPQYRFLPPCYQNFAFEDLPLLGFHPTERGLYFLVEPTVPEGAWKTLNQSVQTYASFLRAEMDGREALLKDFDNARLSTPPDYKGHLFKAADRMHVDPDRFGQIHQDARTYFDGGE